MPVTIFRALSRSLLGALFVGVFVVSGIIGVAPQTAHAATGINQQMNFQGRLLNAQGAVVPDGYYNIQFKIYQDGTGTTAGNPGGTLKWTEDWLNTAGNGVQVKNGFMSVQLGTINPFGSQVDWNQDTLWLSVNIGTTNTTCTPFSSCGGDGEMVPMKRLASVAYAMNAGSLGGLTASGFIQNTTMPQSANIAVQSASAGSVGAVVQGASSQSVDLFQLQDSSGNVNASFNSTGNQLTLGRISTSGTIAQGKLVLSDGALDGFGLTLQTGTLTDNRTIILPNSSAPTDTICLQTLGNCNNTTATRTVSTSASGGASGAIASLRTTGTDFINTSTTNAEATINSAITSLGSSGGVVYLMEGTYIVSGSINIPNNVSLSGTGAGTVIKTANGANISVGLLQNSDQTNGNNHITIENLKLNGNKSNQTSGAGTGINFVKVGGDSTTIGAHIANIWVENFRDNGIVLNNSSRSTITNVSSHTNDNNGLGLQATSYTTISGSVFSDNTNSNSSGITLSVTSFNNTITGNTLTNNGVAGLVLSGNSYGNTATGNTMNNNIGQGLSMINTTDNVITGNTIKSNGIHGIRVNTSTGNVISGNNVADNGQVTTSSDAIFLLSGSLSNTITGNKLSDTAGTGYALELQAGANTNTIGGNLLTWNTATPITDSGTGTIYQNQTDSSGNLKNSTGKTSGFFQSNDGTNNTDATVILKVQGSSTADLIQAQNSSATTLMRVTSTGIVQGSSFDTATGATQLTIGATNASSIMIGKTAGTAPIALSSSTISLGIATSPTTLQGTTQTTAGAQGSAITIQGATGNGNGAGGGVTIQGGTGGGGNANGGTLSLSGGSGTGTGVTGLVNLNPTAFTSATGQTIGTDTTLALSLVNSNSTIPVNATATSLKITVPTPTTATIGRILYITASNTSNDFSLLLANTSGVTASYTVIGMRQNNTATLIWNGYAWTAAGASSSTDLQSAYNNTLQSAGGAELIVSKTSATNGLTIRDSTTNPVNGTLLSIQTKSAAGLLQVNSNVTEYASNAGAETIGASATTFPASTWGSTGTATVTRQNVAGNYIATGQGSVSIAATAANSGAKNQLVNSAGSAAALTANTTYNVSFTARLTSGSSTFTDLNVQFSADGGTSLLTACGSTYAVNTSIWTKVNCTFTTPASGITSGNAILIRQTASATRTFYVDNLSVTIAADYNFATDGSVNDSGNYATNWPNSGQGTVTSSRITSDGNDASDSAQAAITTGAANAGVRNKLSSNPLSSTLYRVTVYGKLMSGAAFSDFKIRYSYLGSTSTTAGDYVDCVDYNTQTLVTTGWTKVTCYIQTDANAATNPYVYFVEATSGVRTFAVDSFGMTLASITTPNVQVGGGINGGPTTLFTLDKGASAPIASNNDALLGSMYYDTTLGKLQCYEADGWGACGSSPDNIVTISPEYTNAVLHGTGIGTMTSDLCSDYLNINDGSGSPAQPTICGTNETYNFYKWTSPQATAQTYSIYVTYQLPSTFKEFNSGQTSLMGRTDNGSGGGSATVQYQIYRNSGTGLTACGSTISVSTGTQTSWQIGNATGAADPSTCGFAPGNSIVFKINVTTSKNANAYVGNLNFAFSNK